MKPVLMVIDMQKDFFQNENRLAEQSKALIDNINFLVSYFRKNDLPIIWVQQRMKADFSDAPLTNKKSGKPLVVEGTEGCKLLDGLDFNDNDYQVFKTKYSGFFKTNLDEILNGIDADTLIACGINSHACVRTTVIDAYQRDYEVVIAKDCVASYDNEHHQISLRYLGTNISKLMSNSEITELIK